MGFDLEKMTSELKRDEGFKGLIYECTAGKKTYGYGHNGEDNPMPEYIAEKLLQHDIGEALARCEGLPWFYYLNDTRKRVIVNMVFNMGVSGVSKFKKMIAAIEAKDWNEAGAQMVDSGWYRQVNNRASRLVKMMING